jgi:hypothetical protein
MLPTNVEKVDIWVIQYDSQTSVFAPFIFLPNGKSNMPPYLLSQVQLQQLLSNATP